MKFGLTEKEIKAIQNVIRQFPQIKKVVIFGSRAMGNFKRGSDVDLAVMGKADQELAPRVSGLLNEETTLPYRFDIVSYHSISNVELKRHIDEKGMVFYEV